jgi:glucokinase
VTVIIGVDVGGTTMSGGLVSPGGEILTALRAPTPRTAPEEVVGRLMEMVAELGSRAAALGLVVSGAGVGVPGLVNAQRGVVGGLVILVPGLARIPLAERLSAEFGVPAFVDNDANTLALGEWMFGLGRDAASFVLLAVGSGVGGAVILDGRLIRGKDGYAGEFGHIPVELAGPPCRCGGRGCLCAYLAGAALAGEAKRRVGASPHSRLLALAGGDPGAITAETIFAAAAAGDDIAESMVQQACRVLGAGLAMIVNGLNPEVVMVTGGVVESLIPVQDRILSWARQYALADSLAGTRIHLVGGDKGRSMRGGAALVLYERSRRASPTPR